MGELVRGVLLPELPRGVDPGRPGSDALVRRLERLGSEIAALAPDAIVLAAGHWVTTFHHYVAGAARFGGAATEPGGAGARAGPSLAHPGHPALARALVAAGRAGRVPAVLTDEPELPLGEADLSLVGGVRAAGDLPIVPVSLCYLADLGETLRWGRAIAAAVRQGPWRVVLAVAERRTAIPVPATDRWDRTASPSVRAVPPGALDPSRRALLPARVPARPDLPGLASARPVALLTGALGAGGAGAGGDAALATLAGSAGLGLSPN